MSLLRRLFRLRRRAAALPALPPPAEPEPEVESEVQSEAEPAEDSDISPARLDRALERLREEIPARSGEGPAGPSG